MEVVSEMATINVTSTANSGAGSLRQAITDLNAQTGSHTITFTGLTGTITLASALPAINKSMTITGPGLSSLTISGNSLYRIFYINTGFTVSITDLTIVNGRAVGAGTSGFGGSVFNNGTLTVSNCYFSGGYSSYGGGIFSYGTLTVTNSSFVSNTGTSSGSGISSFSGGLTVGNCTFSANIGAAIYTQTAGSVIYNCTLNGNSYNGSTHSGIEFAIRGAASLLSSTISGNTSSSSGYAGAVYLG
jgi:hypothetical protein